MLTGLPVVEFSNALAYYDAYRSARLPANLLQAQRDFFGAHTYERNDKPRGQFFHTNWTGRGGTTNSSTYNVKPTRWDELRESRSEITTLGGCGCRTFCFLPYCSICRPRQAHQ